jgi:hypothetical protein
MANGREEEAHAFLTKYHGNGRSDSKLVALQIAEMREGIRQDGIDKTWWDCEFLKTMVSFWKLILRPTSGHYAQRSMANGPGSHDFHLWSILR